MDKVKQLIAVFTGMVAFTTSAADYYFTWNSNSPPSKGVVQNTLLYSLFGTNNVRISNMGRDVPIKEVTNGVEFVLNEYRSQYQTNNVYIFSIGDATYTNDLGIPTVSWHTLILNKDSLHKNTVEFAPYYPWVERQLLSQSQFEKTFNQTITLPSYNSSTNLISITLYAIASASISVDLNGINLITNTVISQLKSVVQFTNAITSSTNVLKLVCLTGDVYYDKTEITYSRTSTQTVNVINLNRAPEFDFSPTNKADYIAVYPPQYSNEAARLCDYRNLYGLQSMAVPLDAIYFKYNSGFANPLALRNFFYQSATEWAVGPKYITLVGHGSLEYLNTNSCTIPLLPSIDAEGNQIGSDVLLTDFTGDDGADIAIGRLSITSTNDFNIWFAKMTNFETQVDNTNGVAAAGLPDPAGNFGIDSDLMIAYFTNISFTKSYSPQTSNGDIRTNTLNGINAGARVVSYFGQGNNQTFGDVDENFLLASDYISFTNKKCHLLVGMACLGGDFGSSLNVPSLIERWVFSSIGGSVASLGVNGVVFGTSSRNFASTWASLFFNGCNRIGDALPSTYQTYNITEKYAYNLLGDPATAFFDRGVPRTGPANYTNDVGFSNYVRLTVASIALSTNMLNPNADSDGDTISNYDEYLASTDMFNGNSLLKITSMTLSNFTFTSRNHVVYTIQYGSNINAFAPIGTVTGKYPYSTCTITNIGFFAISVKGK